MQHANVFVIYKSSGYIGFRTYSPSLINANNSQIIDRRFNRQKCIYLWHPVSIPEEISIWTCLILRHFQCQFTCETIYGNEHCTCCFNTLGKLNVSTIYLSNSISLLVRELVCVLVFYYWRWLVLVLSCTEHQLYGKKEIQMQPTAHSYRSNPSCVVGVTVLVFMNAT